MRCQICRSVKSRTTDSRNNDVGIRRRRECLSCGHRWTTIEVTDTWVVRNVASNSSLADDLVKASDAAADAAKESVKAAQKLESLLAKHR